MSLANRIPLATLLFLGACGTDNEPSESLPLQGEATAVMVPGPGTAYGYGSTVLMTIRLTNPRRDTAWVWISPSFDGPIGALVFQDEARSIPLTEIWTAATIPAPLPEPVRTPIPPHATREWTSTLPLGTMAAYISGNDRYNTEGRYGLALELVGDTIRVPAATFTFDAGLGRLMPETVISIAGTGTSRTLESVTHLRNISRDSVGIFYGMDICNVELVGYRTADRSGTPDWRTDFQACGFIGLSDMIAPGDLSFEPQRSVPRNVDTLLGTLPRQRYYVILRMNLNKVRIERPVGEVDFTPP